MSEARDAMAREGHSFASDTPFECTGWSVPIPRDDAAREVHAQLAIHNMHFPKVRDDCAVCIFNVLEDKRLEDEMAKYIDPDLMQFYREKRAELSDDG